VTDVNLAGSLTFARFAYPPNALGYCGPDDPSALLGLTAAGRPGPDLADLARRFAGAWPYLRLIGAASGRDPLDPAVVEAYWVGNRLLDRIDPRVFAAHLNDRFADRAGAGAADLATLAVLGAVPHHNFHVFAVYPWVGLLRAGHGGGEPLRVMNSCRIRWGRIHTVTDGLAEVVTQPLRWDGRTLHLGPSGVESMVYHRDGAALAPRLRPGDVVALHWDWVCDVLSPGRLAALRSYTALTLRMTNEALLRPTAAAILD
jgi:hypothetical protein